MWNILTYNIKLQSDVSRSLIYSICPLYITLLLLEILYDYKEPTINNLPLNPKVKQIKDFLHTYESVQL